MITCSLEWIWSIRWSPGPASRGVVAECTEYEPSNLTQIKASIESGLKPSRSGSAEWVNSSLCSLFWQWPTASRRTSAAVQKRLSMTDPIYFVETPDRPNVKISIHDFPSWQGLRLANNCHERRRTRARQNNYLCKSHQRLSTYI